MYTMIRGHEDRAVSILRSFAERSAVECEGVGFEDSWEEAGADVGADLEEWRVEWTSAGGIEGDGGWIYDGEVVYSC